ncbi:hypothetical protein CPC08DRAFT_748101 [Agrocybe pediades]|nr:hypothetical protein CPC08DRAFT_748101 [Agrocybe pediades]
MSAVQVTKIDDRDPSVIRSPGDWSNGGNGKEYLGTTTRTNRLGASLRIPFTGTKILIYGTIDSAELGQTPTSLFSVDDGRATQFVGTQFADAQNYQQKFYESPDLDLGAHNLLITVSSAPSVKASFTFDWAEIYNEDVADADVSDPPDSSSSSESVTSTSPVPTPTTTSPESTEDSQPSTSSTIIITSDTATTPLTFLTSDSNQSTPTIPTSSNQSSTSTATPTTRSASQTDDLLPSVQTPDQVQPHLPQTPALQHAPRTLAMVGSIVGSVVLLFLLLSALLYTRRRRSRGISREKKPFDPEMVDTLYSPTSGLQADISHHITPFITSPGVSKQTFADVTRVPEYSVSESQSSRFTVPRTSGSSKFVEEALQARVTLPPDYNTITIQ